jgi:hypothetical protein
MEGPHMSDDNDTPKLTLSIDWLAAHHIGNNDTERQELIDRMYAELSRRTGARLVTHFTDEQIAKFEAYVEANDEDGQLAYLEEVYPDYPTDVKIVFQKLHDDVLGAADPTGYIKSFDL